MLLPALPSSTGPIGRGNDRACKKYKPTDMHLTTLWKNIESRLDDGCPRWRDRIEAFGQVKAVEDRLSGKSWSDDEVFEALVLAVLSSATDWSKIEEIQADLKELFSGFRLESYADRRESEVDDVLVPWFNSRKAGSTTQRRNLKYLIGAASTLLEHSKAHGSAESYFTQLFEAHGKDPKQVALCLGTSGSPHKLPGLGVPLAAEALKNLGFDVAKPDRHVCRAVAAFGLVDCEPGGQQIRVAGAHRKSAAANDGPSGTNRQCCGPTGGAC